MPCLRWLPCRGEAAWAPLYGLTDTELAAHLAAVVRVIAQAQAVLLAAIREADSRGLLGSEDAAVVRAALDPLAVPLPTGPEGPAPRTRPQRLADALVEACQRLLTFGELPDHGGERPA